jgi:hypothetical protein
VDITINYDPNAAEIRKAIHKAYVAAVRAKYAAWADNEIRKGREAIDQRIAEITATGGDLSIELASVFAAHGNAGGIAEIEAGGQE